MKNAVVRECNWFSLKQIEHIEKARNASYVCDTAAYTKDGWTDVPIAIFFQKNPQEGMSRYFGLFFRTAPLALTNQKQLMICDAAPTVDQINSAGGMTGVSSRDGSIVYSRFRHDCYASPDASIYIDGGRDYTRVGGKFLDSTTYHSITIVDGELVVNKIDAES